MPHDVEDRLARLASDVSPAFTETRSRFEALREVIPGGSSRSRFWWPYPVLIERGQGALVWDVDGNEYVDGLMAHGPMILGHSHPEVVEALTEQIRSGLAFGGPSPDEGELGKRIVELVPGAERVTMVSTGTEATMTAIRLARTATGRGRLAKFVSGYHGWADATMFVPEDPLVPDAAELRAVPDSPGLPPALAADVLLLRLNDRRSFDALRRDGDDIACVFIELIQGAGGAVQADREFVHELRAVCDELGILLVIDEVFTGFRVGLHGASGLYGVKGDLITLAKIMGGGLPGAAVAGRADLFRSLEPDVASATRAPVVSAGTHAVNAAVMTAGRVTLDILIRDQATIYPELDRLGVRVRDGIQAAIDECGWGVTTGYGSTWGFFASTRLPDDGDFSKIEYNFSAGRAMGLILLREGVLGSSPVHLGLLSSAHTDAHVDRIVRGYRVALTETRARGFLD